MSDQAHENGAIPLAEIHSGELDDEILAQLFLDIQTHGTVLSVMVKGGAETFADGAQPSLTSALKMLGEKQIRGVQIRYLFDGVEWWDTLLTGGERVRLLRTAAPT